MPKPPETQPKWPKAFLESHPVLHHKISDRNVNEGLKLIKKFTPKQLGSLAPKQVPGYYSACPHCKIGIDKGRGTNAKRNSVRKHWQWSVKTPNRLVCKNCDTIYPNAKYKMTQTASYLNPKGETIKLPCYKDDKKRAYHLEGTTDSFKHEYLKGRVGKLAQAYHVKKNERCARAVIEIMKGYARSWPHWLTHDGTHYFSTGGPWLRDGKKSPNKWSPYGWCESRYGVWTTWWFAGYPKSFLDAYDLVYRHPAWDSEKGPDGSSLRFWVERNTFDDQTEWLLSFPWPNQIRNNLASQIGHIVRGAMVMGRPDYARFARQWCRILFYEYDSHHDMMTNEGPGYHHTWLTSIRGNYRTAALYNDPPGYKDANGVQLLGADPREFPAKKRQTLGFLMLCYPDGTRYPIGDTPRNMLWHYPLRKSENRIAPGFGCSVLGDGAGPVENHVHATLTWSGGNHSHCHEDGLSLLLFANGVELFSDTGGMWDAHNTWFHNCVSIDRKISQKIKGGTPHGDLEMHIPNLPGIALARVDGRASCYPDASRYERTLIHNTVDSEHPYVVDVFRAKGGELHEYFLQGSMEAKTKIAEYDPKMVQKGSCSMPLGAYGDPSGKIPGAWKGFHDLRSAPMDQDGYVDFRFTGKPDLGTRTHFSKSDGTTLVLGKSVCFRGAKIAYGKNDLNKDVIEGFTVPKLILQRRSKNGDLDSLFVLIHEPVKGKSVIGDFSYTVNADGVIAVRLKAGDRTDYYALSQNGPKPLASGPLTGHGVFACATVKGDNCDVWMANATEAKCLGKALVNDGAEYVGEVLRVARRETGAVHDGYLTDAPIPIDRNWLNEMVMIDVYDDAGERVTVIASEIIDVIPDGNKRWVTIKQDAAVVKNEDGTWREIFYPHRKNLGATCKLRIVPSATTIPRLSIIPGKGRVETRWVNDFVSTAGNDLTIVASRPDASLYVNGKTRGTGKATVTLTEPDSRLSISVGNPSGVMTLRPQTVRVLRPLPPARADAAGLQPGVQWMHHKGSGKGYEAAKDGVDDKYLVKQGVSDRIRPQFIIGRSNSMIYDGYLEVPETGEYTFYSLAEGSARLTIDGVDVIEAVHREDDYEWGASIHLEKGLHEIRHVYTYTRWGSCLFSLKWRGPGIEKSFIEKGHLFHAPKEAADE